MIDFKKLTTWTTLGFIVSFLIKNDFYLHFLYYLSIFTLIGSNFIILCWPRLICKSNGGISLFRSIGNILIHYLPPFILYLCINYQHNISAFLSALLLIFTYWYYAPIRKIYGFKRTENHDLTKLQRKPRIMIISACCPNMINGIVIRLKNMIKDEKYQFKWLTTSTTSKVGPKKCGDIDTFYLSSLDFPLYKDYGIGTPFAYVQVFKLFKEFDPDIVHVANAEFCGIFLWILALIYGKKLVGSIHTDMTFIGKQKWWGFIVVGIIKWVHLSYNWCDILVTSSHIHADRLKSEGIYVNAILPMCPFDPKLFNNKTDEVCRNHLRSEWGGDRILLYIGRISIEKNLDVVLEALKKVKNNSDTRLTWVIVGDGPERNRWVQLHGLEISRNIYVHFLGKFIPYENVPDYYRAADVVIGPCENETLGFTAVEARLCGKKFIARNSGGYIQSNAGGLFFNNVDDLTPLILNHVLVEGENVYNTPSIVNDKDMSSLYQTFDYMS
jgi:glycosyltransferase involved in cell wall biosynthesis